MVNGPGWKTGISAMNPTVEPAAMEIVDAFAAFARVPTLHLMSLDLTSVTGELVLVFALMLTYSPLTAPALMNLRKRSRMN